MSFIKIYCNCENCGHDTEVYGPFKTEEEAEKFSPNEKNHSIAGMTCITEHIEELKTEVFE